MRKSRRRNRGKQNLEQQLGVANDRLAKLQVQLAKFGTLHVPVHIMTEIEEEEAKIAGLEKQILAIKRSNPLFRFTERSKLKIRFFSDLLFPRNQLARRRRRNWIRGWQAKIGATTLKVLMAIVLIGMISFITINRAYLTQALVAQSGVIPSVVPSSPGTQLTPLNINLQRAKIITPSRTGVLHRTLPRTDAPSDPGPQEGDTVYLIEFVTNDRGELWWKVQQADGRVGYVMAQYLDPQ